MSIFKEGIEAAKLLLNGDLRGARSFTCQKGDEEWTAVRTLVTEFKDAQPWMKGDTKQAIVCIVVLDIDGLDVPSGSYHYFIQCSKNEEGDIDVMITWSSETINREIARSNNVRCIYPVIFK